MIIIAFFPTSDLYSIPLNLTEKRQIIFTIGSVLIHILLFGVIGYIFYDKNWINTDWKAFLQYNYLAEALRDGHCYLNFTPPEILSTINNPYDNSLRNQILNQAGEQIITDFAYYNGRYYSYFGVIPVIMFYLPYLLLTGKPLSTGALLIGIVFLFIIASFCMVYRLFEKYYSKVSLGTYLLLTSVFIAGSEITYCVQMPTIYSVPLALGLTLDLLGISFWLSAAQPDGSVKKSCLIAGAACIALTVGCRPQLAIVTLFAFPIFWKEIKERKFFSVKGMGNTLSVILPFLVIDTALLYYNIVRFGSPLNFGATYNLTGFDMTHRGFILDRFVLGIWEYLFQPFNIKSSFPYFTIVAGHMDLQSDYQGQLINEPLMGGFFAFNLIAIFIFSLPNIKQELKKKGVLGFLILSLVSGLVIVGLDIQMIGMTLRYLTDFSVFLILSAIIVIGALLEKYTDNKPFYKSLLSLTIMLSFLCIATNYITLIANGRYNHLISSNPWIFYRIKYEICSLLSIR